MSDKDEMLTPGEVAKLFRVDPRTVGRWANACRVPSIRTPGGHRRYPAAEVRELIKASFTPAIIGQKLRQLDSIIEDKEDKP